MGRSWPFQAQDGIPILMYHKLGQRPAGARVPGHFVSARLFRAHLQAFARLGYRAVSLDQVAHFLTTGEAAVERPFAITFDDGYQCLYRWALPILAGIGYMATIFLVAGAVGGYNLWDQEEGDVAQAMLSPSEIKDLQGAGCQFGSHSLTHCHLDRLPSQQMEEELARSRDLLEQITGEPIRHLAYPYGGYNAQVEEVASGCGYLTASTTQRGVARPGTPALRLPRINVRRYNLTALLLGKVRRAYGERLP